MLRVPHSSKSLLISVSTLLLFGLIFLSGASGLVPDTCYAASPCEGNFDDDSDVDGSDVAVFSSELGRTDCAWGDPCEGAFENNDEMSGSDLAILAADFGRIDCPQACPPQSYVTYFTDHPTIANASVNTFDSETLGYFCTYLEQLETTGIIDIEEPLQSRNCIEPQSCRYILLSSIEVKKIVAARVAHSVWLDKNNLLSWNLDGYTEDELAGLFDKNKLFNASSVYYYFNSVVDHSPSEVYEYAENNNLIADDVVSTVHAVLNDLRTTDSKKGFRHGSTYLGDYTDTAYTVYEALTTYSGESRVSRRGCHSMTRITLGLLRSLNIPGEETHGGEWFGVGHSSAVWPALEGVMPHGDDIYNALLWAAPVEEFLPPFEFYADTGNIAVCGMDMFCLSLRHRSLLAIKYPSSYTVARCCFPNSYGYASCSEYLNDSHGDSLTAEEITNAIVQIQRLCD